MSGNSMGDLALEIQKASMHHAAQAVAGLAAELGTITEKNGVKGVKLDRFQHVFEDCLFLEPHCDIDIEIRLQVPAHEETGQIELPSIPIQGGGSTEAGTYDVTYKFDDWVFESDPETAITIFGARLKQIPEYVAGSRVLCAPVNGGRDVVVISKIGFLQ